MILVVAAGSKLWSNAMEILEEKDGVDTELLVYAMTLINKVSEYHLYLSILLWYQPTISHSFQSRNQSL